MKILDCKVKKKCGSCDYIGMDYARQLSIKQKEAESLLSKYGKVDKIIPMEEPYHYRNKVNATFGYDRGKVISGTYEKNSHRIVDTQTCLLEDERAKLIINSIKKLLPSFKLKTYDEDRGYGFLRHVLVRVGKRSGQIMVVLVTASPIFASKNHFVKALLALHPEITTIVQNINDKRTSMILGERNMILYGKGYIEDILCDKSFRISPASFYQVNPIQTEKLYQLAIRYADFSKEDRVLDAYCGIGTIGMCIADHVKEVIGVELNPSAIKDAKINASLNQVKNIRFFENDAGDFIESFVASGERLDGLIMDPPRSGSTKKFMDSIIRTGLRRLVYISCNPQTLARDLEYLTHNGYVAKKITPVDQFVHTKCLEVVVLLEKRMHTKRK